MGLRVGLAGVGSMGEKHLKKLLTLGVEVVVAEASESRREYLKREYGVEVRDDFRELEGVDAAVITLPTDLHCESALFFVGKGVPVLVEKPLASSTEEGVRMIEEAKKRGVLLAVGHIERFNPIVETIEVLLGSGEVGEVLSILCGRFNPFPVNRAPGLGSDVIHDLAIHDFDVLLGLTGEVPHKTFAFGDKDSVAVSLLYTRFHALVEVSWRVSYSQRRILVVGSEGSLLGDFRDQKLLFFRKDRNCWVDASGGKRDQLEEELKKFLARVRGEDTKVVSGEESLISLAVAESARKSLESGLPEEVILPRL